MNLLIEDREHEAMQTGPRPRPSVLKTAAHQTRVAWQQAPLAASRNQAPAVGWRLRMKPLRRLRIKYLSGSP